MFKYNMLIVSNKERLEFVSHILDGLLCSGFLFDGAGEIVLDEAQNNLSATANYYQLTQASRKILLPLLYRFC